MKHRRIGKIYIGDTITRLGYILGYNAFMRDLKVLEKDRDPYRGEVKILGEHPAFDLVKEGDTMPEYRLRVLMGASHYTLEQINKPRYEDEYHIEPEALTPGPGLTKLNTAPPKGPVLGYEVLDNYPEPGEAYLPHYEHMNDSGFDLRAAIPKSGYVEAGGCALVATGLKFQIPQGFEIQVRPRSGLAAKHAITVLNTPGTIDRGYTGEVKVILFNAGKDHFCVNPGDKIAQAVLCPVVQAHFQKLDSVENTDTRGHGGFGSTGKL